MADSVIEEIKNRLDIVDVVREYVKLEKAGANYRALCPFHSEKKPSFFVSPTRQTWHCFGACNEGGDIFKFIMKIEGVEFGDALRILAQKAGVELKKEDPRLKTERQRLYSILEIACCFFEVQLQKSSAGKEAKNYLKKRGVREETIKKWRLGYAPDTWQGLSKFLISKGYKREEIKKAGLLLESEKTGNYYDRFRKRIIFPISNLSSQIIGFGGRILKETLRPDNQEEAKYINSPSTLLYDKSKTIFGLDKAGRAIREADACILVEGYMDAIMMSQEGIENVVATSGTSLTPYQLRILKRYTNNLLTAFDMDLAGNSATKRGIDLAQSLGFNIKIVIMPEGKDPADLALENPELLKALIRDAKTIHDFYFQDVLSKFDKNTLEGKKEISNILLPVIKRIPNKVEQGIWIKDLSELIEVREEDIREELEKISLAEDSYLTLAKEEMVVPAKNEKKTRKDILQEHMAVLAIKHPVFLNFLKTEDFSYLSPKFSEFFSLYKQKGDFDTSSFPEEKKSFFDYLFLKAEIEQVNKKEAEEDFKNCLREIKKIELRQKINEMTQEIKKAENQNDFERAKELVQKVQQHSELLHKIESA